MQAHLGKQPIARWYFPPEVDYRLQMLPPNATGLVVWILEAKVNTTIKILLDRCPITGLHDATTLCKCIQVLSKAELQFLVLLPTLRPKVRVIAECGNW